jgi:hypothetical protein
MSAPTEQEIRERIRVGFAADDGIRTAVYETANPLTNPFLDTLEPEGTVDGPASSPSALWTDLRTSEAVCLRDMTEKVASSLIERIEAMIVDELVAVGVEFAQRYPDAPRPEPVAV